MLQMQRVPFSPGKNNHVALNDHVSCTIEHYDLVEFIFGRIVEEMSERSRPQSLKAKVAVSVSNLQSLSLKLLYFQFQLDIQ